jgi:tRNA pseudouridine38-40 synthase
MGFHPRFDAVARSYEYRIGLADEAFSPFNRGWCWALERDVDLDLLQRVAGLLVGSHSFGAFAKSGQEHRGDVCRVSDALWKPWEGLGVMFSISANRFLHHMVRYLVGTMVEIGWGRRPPDDLPGLLGGDDGSLVTSRPAPARGLFLSAVEFPPEKIRPPTDPEPTEDHSERITEDPNKR